MNGSTYWPAIWPRLLLVATLLLAPLSGLAQDGRPAHPLDALSGAELANVKAILTIRSARRRGFTTPISTSPKRPKSWGGGRVQRCHGAPLPW
jgi:hypothetical protein